MPRGTKVTIRNPSSSSHTWTQGSGVHPPGGFNSGNLDTGGSYTYTFNTAGSYNFYCKYHYSSDNMKGRITVT